MTRQTITYDSPPHAGCVRVTRGMVNVLIHHDSTEEAWQASVAILGADYSVHCDDGVIVLSWPDDIAPLTVSRTAELMSGTTPCGVTLV